MTKLLSFALSDGQVEFKRQSRSGPFLTFNGTEVSASVLKTHPELTTIRRLYPIFRGTSPVRVHIKSQLDVIEAVKETQTALLEDLKKRLSEHSKNPLCVPHPFPPLMLKHLLMGVMDVLDLREARTPSFKRNKLGVGQLSEWVPSEIQEATWAGNALKVPDQACEHTVNLLFLMGLTDTPAVTAPDPVDVKIHGAQGTGNWRVAESIQVGEVTVPFLIGRENQQVVLHATFPTQGFFDLQQSQQNMLLAALAWHLNETRQLLFEQIPGQMLTSDDLTVQVMQTMGFREQQVNFAREEQAVRVLQRKLDAVGDFSVPFLPVETLLRVQAIEQQLHNLRKHLQGRT